MKKVLLSAAVLVMFYCGYSQCPFPATLSTTGVCLGATLTVNSANTLSQITWYNGTTPVNVATGMFNDGPGITVAGGNGEGPAANQLSPYGLFVDGAGNIYVTDEANNSIQKWAPGATSGITVAGGNGAGNAANQLYEPFDVFVDGAGNIYVTDYVNARIQKWAPGATSGVTVAGNGIVGSSASEFNGPGDIFVDAAGNIYVSDYDNARVQKWAPGASSGVTVAGGNGAGSGANQLSRPYGIFVDAAGNLYVADLDNARIQKWAPGATSGVTVAGGNGSGPGANQLQGPGGVYVDASGNIFIADLQNNRVQEWTPGASSGVTVAGGNGYGPAANQFEYPSNVWMDGSGNLYVTDISNFRVQEYPNQSVANPYTPLVPGVYTAVVRDPSGCTVTTNPITINASVSPAISISQSAATVCTDNPVYTAVAANGGSTPVYQWQIDGVNVGANSPTFSGSHLSYGSTVTCTLTSNAFCAVPSAAVSNPLTVTGVLAATLVNKDPACAGKDTLVVRTADPLAQITWYNATSPVSTVSSTQALTGVTVAGNNGVGYSAGQLNFPLGIWVDASGNVYVADNMNNRIQEWAPGASTGVTVVGSSSTLWQPAGLFIDGSGNIWVADMGNNRVVEFPAGSNVNTVGITVAGGNGAGTAANQLNNPRSVFVDASGNLYVVDQYNERVQKFPPGSTSATAGVTVAGRPNALGDPIGIFVDGAGNIYVSEAGYSDVSEWAPGASSGVIVAGGNGQGPAANQLDAPGNIHVDANGNIYIADEVNNRIQKWAPGATSGITVAGGNGSGPAANQVSAPEGVYVDMAGNVYASDLVKNSVQKWSQQPVIDTTYIAAAPGTYTAFVTGEGGCTMTTNALVVIATVVPSVTIDAPVTAVCAGSSATFTATPSNGGTTPVYEWQVNGVNAAANTAVFSSNTLADKDVVTCLMTSNAVCPSPATTTSNSIPITVSPLSTPAISIAASTTGICSGASVSFSATPFNGGNAPVYTWSVNGNTAGANSPSFSSTTLANGDIIACGLVSSASCLTVSTAQSNTIPITVHPTVAPSLTAEASATAICAGQAVSFKASLGNSIDQPVYQWQVDGMAVGSNSPGYTTSTLSNGDVVICQVTGDAGCAIGSSGSIVMTVYPLPQVDAGPAIALPAGQSITLSPQVTGDINTYSWTPGLGLSDSTILDPVASPVRTTLYTLTVTTAEGCTASGSVKVGVFGALRIPNAFTPNGDGRNDIFYVLGGPAGSSIMDLSVYNRWGQKIFQVHDVLPADPAFGWNGTYNGSPSPSGAYVYSLTIRFADGTQQQLQGTVILVR
jgi:gliding motility-associated-like protein